MRLSLFAAAALLMTSLAARADTLTDFTLNATLANGGTENGTLTLDRTTNMFLPGNITVVSGGTTYVLQFSSQYDDRGTYNTIFSDSDSYKAVVRLPALSSLDGYQGGQIASDTYYSSAKSYFVYNSAQNFIDVQFGTLLPAAPTAVTPEPSSLALLGTGILGVFGVMKRRFA